MWTGRSGRALSKDMEWHYTDQDPEGLHLLERLRASETWSSPRLVWTKVLEHAKREANYTDRKASKKRWIRRAARKWIFHGGENFLWVCRAAGEDPEYYQARVKAGLK